MHPRESHTETRALSGVLVAVGLALTATTHLLAAPTTGTPASQPMHAWVRFKLTKGEMLC